MEKITDIDKILEINEKLRIKTNDEEIQKIQQDEYKNVIKSIDDVFLLSDDDIVKRYERKCGTFVLSQLAEKLECTFDELLLLMKFEKPWLIKTMINEGILKWEI